MLSEAHPERSPARTPVSAPLGSSGWLCCMSGIQVANSPLASRPLAGGPCCPSPIRMRTPGGRAQAGFWARRLWGQDIPGPELTQRVSTNNQISAPVPPPPLEHPHCIQTFQTYLTAQANDNVLPPTQVQLGVAEATGTLA